MYFAIYETEIQDEFTGKTIKERKYATIPLNIVIKRLKQGLSPAPDDKNGNAPTFVLSPNDLVYVPTSDDENSLDQSNIYRIVSFTGNRLYGIPYSVANTILDKVEYSQLNKIEFADNQSSIKENCIPVRIDRLGNIIKIGY